MEKFKNLKFILLTIIFLLFSGCATIKVINKSPKKDIPEMGTFKTINAKLHVVCIDTLTNLCDDIASELTANNVFDSVLTGSFDNNLQEVKLEIIAHYEENDHFGSELGKACLTGFLQGCLLGIVDKSVESMFSDKYDYQITIDATLSISEKRICNIKSVGKYYAERPESDEYGKTIAQKAVGTVIWEDSIKEKALKHAIKVLIYKIKQKRDIIEKAIGH